MSNEEKILEMLTDMRSDIKQINGRLDRLETDVSELKADVKVLDERSLKSAVLLETDVARDTHLLYEGHSELKRQLDTLATKEQMEDLAGVVHVIKEVVSGHSRDIGRLKKAQ